MSTEPEQQPQQSHFLISAHKIRRYARETGLKRNRSGVGISLSPAASERVAEILSFVLHKIVDKAVVIQELEGSKTLTVEHVYKSFDDDLKRFVGDLYFANMGVLPEQALKFLEDLRVGQGVAEHLKKIRERRAAKRAGIELQPGAEVAEGEDNDAMDVDPQDEEEDENAKRAEEELIRKAESRDKKARKKDAKALAKERALPEVDEGEGEDEEEEDEEEDEEEVAVPRYSKAGGRKAKAKSKVAEVEDSAEESQTTRTLRSDKKRKREALEEGAKKVATKKSRKDGTTA